LFVTYSINTISTHEKQRRNKEKDKKKTQATFLFFILGFVLFCFQFVVLKGKKKV